MDDVIAAHAHRLPALDERWTPRSYAREDLLTGLLARGVAGTATHPLDNVRGNILMLIDGDRDKLFGLSGLPGELGLEEILGLVADAAGAPIDPEARYGPVDIRPEPILRACEALGDRLAAAALRGETVVVATGHPIGLVLLYRQIARLAADRGAKIATPARGVRWRDPGLPHDWSVQYLEGVALLTDGREPRHTHSPDAMRRIIADSRPDLVLADHGFAGAAIEAGIETLSVADVNDPALLVAKALGRTEVVIVMDDHVEPDAYWPCFQAVASRFSPSF
jgi:histidinol phosphate phosphatase hisN-like protein